MKKNRKLILLLLTTITVLIFAACSNKKEEKAEETSNETVGETNQASLELDKTIFEAENWKTDGSHHKTVTGKLQIGHQPVADAKIQVSDKRVAVTDENGNFTLTVDANIVEREVIHVVDLEDAKVDGKPLNEKQKGALMELKEELIVHYPIVVEKVKPNPKDNTLVDVYASAVVKKGEKFPKFGVEKFPVIGTIKDHEGKPVEGAFVNLRRDGVEGFTMSEPSDENGTFAMFYIPEDDEAHYLNVYVPSTDTYYTLPDSKAFYFPDDFGIQLDITLPKEGTVIQDKPPTLVASNAEGALHKGVLIGLNATDYKITIPNRDGTFKVTLPKLEWEKNPTFYEINYRGYFKDLLESGDTLSSKQIPLPDDDEPNQIQATMK